MKVSLCRAKSLQPCLTLDPAWTVAPPSSSARRVLRARILEWRLPQPCSDFPDSPPCILLLLWALQTVVSQVLFKGRTSMCGFVPWRLTCLTIINLNADLPKGRGEFSFFVLFLFSISFFLMFPSGPQRETADFKWGSALQRSLSHALRRVST